MAHIWSFGTAVPPHVVTRDELKRIARRHFRPIFGEDLAPFDSIVDHTMIARRHLVRPAEELFKPRSLSTTTLWFAESTIDLARRALQQAAERAGVRMDEIDALVTCSATGFLVPSVDVYLANELGMRRDVRRHAFGSLACAGGVGGLGRANDLAAQHRIVALVTVDVPSITFRPEDRSMKNVIAATLFADGAAAMILGPPRSGAPHIIASSSWLHPGTTHAMGLDLVDGGFDVVLSADVPELTTKDLKEVIASLVRRSKATASDLSWFALHPGGRKVLERVEQRLGLARAQTQTSFDVLREYGNMSAPTVLFVLERALADAHPGSLGLAAAFGPGLTAELALVQR